MDSGAYSEFISTRSHSLTLLGANLERGIIRANALQIEPTFFNIATWLNQGIQHPAEFDCTLDPNCPDPLNPSKDKERYDNAVDHGNRVVRTLGEIYAYSDLFGLELPNDSVFFSETEVQYLDDDRKELFGITDE